LKVIVNAEPQDIEEGASVADLLRHMEAKGESVAVMVNDLIVPRADLDAHRLASNDRVEVVTLVRGG
jgi:thiamine biosynthesis protein ThiS